MFTQPATAPTTTLASGSKVQVTNTVNIQGPLNLSDITTPSNPFTVLLPPAPATLAGGVDNMALLVGEMSPSVVSAGVLLSGPMETIPLNTDSGGESTTVVTLSGSLDSTLMPADSAGTLTHN